MLSFRISVWRGVILEIVLLSASLFSLGPNLLPLGDGFTGCPGVLRDITLPRFKLNCLFGLGDTKESEAPNSISGIPENFPKDVNPFAPSKSSQMLPSSPWISLGGIMLSSDPIAEAFLYTEPVLKIDKPMFMIPMFESCLISSIVCFICRLTIATDILFKSIAPSFMWFE